MTRGQRKRVFVITICWVVISQLLFYNAHIYLLSAVPADLLGTLSIDPFLTQVSYLLTSLFGGLFFGYKMVTERPASSSFIRSIVAISIWYLIIFLASIIGVTVVVTVVAAGVGGLALLPENLFGVLTNRSVLSSFLIWGIVVAGTKFLLQVADMFGQGVLGNLITGEYFQPKEEMRIFMFMDLKSSTTIAERLGHIIFFEFLREVYKDVTEPILAHRGEIYQYVGDEVVVSWVLEAGKLDGSCIRCFDAVVQRLGQLESDYQKRYQAVPEFRAAVHCGRVTVGEIGVIKKQIVFTGDVLNTTARLLEQCKNFNTDLIISDEIVTLLSANSSLKFKHLDDLELRGKAKSIGLYSLA